MRGVHTRMIFDSEKHYPRSVVLYTRFSTYPLRQMFAYLREKEKYYQADLEKYRGTVLGNEVAAKLREVEAQLIFMAHNLR